jgi:hypothetical protein
MARQVQQPEFPFMLPIGTFDPVDKKFLAQTEFTGSIGQLGAKRVSKAAMQCFATEGGKTRLTKGALEVLWGVQGFNPKVISGVYEGGIGQKDPRTGRPLVKRQPFNIARPLHGSAIRGIIVAASNAVQKEKVSLRTGYPRSMITVRHIGEELVDADQKQYAQAVSDKWREKRFLQRSKARPASFRQRRTASARRRDMQRRFLEFIRAEGANPQEVGGLFGRSRNGGGGGGAQGTGTAGAGEQQVPDSDLG